MEILLARALCLVRCLLVLVLTCASMLPMAQAQAPPPVALDRSFGNDGFVALPLVEEGSPAPVPLGIVRTPISAGYIAFSVQRVAGVPRIVASRFMDGGDLSFYWGDGGSRHYSLPNPVDREGKYGADRQIRMAVNMENDKEVIYVAFLFRDFSGIQLMVARLGADGSLISTVSSALASAFTEGPLAITAIAPAQENQLETRNPGILLAVQGKSEVDKTALLQISTRLGSIDTTISGCESLDRCPVRPGLRISQLLPRDDNNFDISGTERGQAMYMRYNPRTNALGWETYFNVPVGECGGSPVTMTVADGQAYDAMTDRRLLIGRGDCGVGGKYWWVAKISVDPGPFMPTIIFSGRLSESISGCENLLVPCRSSLLGFFSSSDLIYAATPSSLVRIHGGSGVISGIEGLHNSRIDMDITLGEEKVSLNGSYLIGGAKRGSKLGLARVVIDRLFASGME